MRPRFSHIAFVSLIAAGSLALGMDVARAQAPAGGAPPATGDLKRPVNLSPEEMQKQGDATVLRIEGGATAVRRMLEKARSDRDVVKAICLSDKLNQLDRTVASARDRKESLDAAAKRKDNDQTAHEFSILTALRQRSDRLMSEAQQCIGSDLGVIGDTRTTQTVDPDIPEDEQGVPPSPVIPMPAPPIPISNALLRTNPARELVNTRSLLRGGVRAAALLSGLGAVEVARADEVAKPVPNEVWIRDTRYRQGPGFQTEQYKISPWIGAGLEYDSNVFLRSGKNGETPVVDAFRLALTPFLSIEPRGNTRGRSYAFYGAIGGSYYEYFKGFTKPGPGDDLSGHRNASAMALAKLVFAPGAKVSGDLHGQLVRTVQPGNLGDPTSAYNRTTPSAGLGVQWAPGGGLFTWSVGYDVAFTFFDETQFKNLNNTAHTVATTSSWRFLPRTSVFTDARATLFRYSDSATTQSNGDSVSAKAGLNGLVTNGFGFLVAAGWSSTFFDTKGASNGDFDSFIAQVEGRFYLTPPPADKDKPGAYPSTLVLGYLRDWQQSYIGNFFQRDRAYANVGYFLGGRWFATLGGGFSRLHFPQTVFPDGTLRAGAFNNYAVDATGTLEFRPTPHVAVSTSVGYAAMLSDTRLPSDPNNNTVADDQAWSRITAMIGGRYLF